MSTLDKIQIRHTIFRNRIVLARVGKDPLVSLETRDATSDFYQALVSFAFDAKIPEPGATAEVNFGGGDEQFVLTLQRKARSSALSEGGEGHE